MILFGLTHIEKELLKRFDLPYRTAIQLARSSSSIAPTLTQKKIHICSELAPHFSHQPPRYFARGALEKDRKLNSRPFFLLLTESEENQPKPRPLPSNRKLPRSLCRGQGRLRQAHGQLFLDVNDQFILSMLSFLAPQGSPHFNLFILSSEAHISVIPQREAEFRDVGWIREVGKTFSFEIEGFYSVKPCGWPEVEEIWYFKVLCPEMERLRQKYFLPAFPGGHPFMIATAIRPSKTPKRSQPLMRISPSAYAA